MFLVTGYGSIGTLLVEKLVTQGRTIIIDKDEKAIHKALIRFKDVSHVECVVADISIKDDLRKIFLNYEFGTILHTAAMKHVTFCEKNPHLATINNILGINNLLDLAAAYGIEKFVNVSTDKSASPCNVMGATKFIAERIVLSYNGVDGRRSSKSMKCQSVRLGNVLNSNGSLIPTIINIVENNRTLDLTDLKATRFFITPDEVSEFIVGVALKNHAGDIIIKKLKSATLETMVGAVLESLGRKDYENTKIVGLRQGEKLHEHLFSDAESNCIRDYGDYWSIDYNSRTPTILPVDSSQFCVSQKEFLNILRDLDVSNSPSR